MIKEKYSYQWNLGWVALYLLPQPFLVGQLDLVALFLAQLPIALYETKDRIALFYVCIYSFVVLAEIASKNIQTYGGLLQ